MRVVDVAKIEVPYPVWYFFGFLWFFNSRRTGEELPRSSQADSHILRETPVINQFFERYLNRFGVASSSLIDSDAPKTAGEPKKNEKRGTKNGLF